MIALVRHCGIDVGLKSHAVCLLDGSNKTLRKYSIGNDIEGFKRIEKDICSDTKICLEPTGVYSVNIFLYFRNAGFDIRFCETKSSRRFREAMFDKKKHDHLDCVALAKYRIVNEERTFDGEKVLNNLSYESCDQLFSKLRSMLLLYSAKSKDLARTKNKIKALVDLRFPEAIKVFPYNRGCRTIINALCHSKKDVLSGRLNLRKQSEIQKHLEQSIGQYGMKAKEFQMIVIDADVLESEIKALKTDIGDELKKNGYTNLFDYCGLNSVNIATFISEVQDISRFYRYNSDGGFSKKKSLKAFKNFIGITVTSNQSGEKEGGHKLVKSGCKSARNVLMLLAFTYISMKNAKGYDLKGGHDELNPVKYNLLYEEYTKRTKKMIAITKIMSKIATDLFFVLKSAQQEA
ncbi:MAG: transposase [Bacteroidota bacterium]